MLRARCTSRQRTTRVIGSVQFAFGYTIPQSARRAVLVPHGCDKSFIQLSKLVSLLLDPDACMAHLSAAHCMVIQPETASIVFQRLAVAARMQRSKQRAASVYMQLHWQLTVVVMVMVYGDGGCDHHSWPLKNGHQNLPRVICT